MARKEYLYIVTGTGLPLFGTSTAVLDYLAQLNVTDFRTVYSGPNYCQGADLFHADMAGGPIWPLL